MAVIDALTRFAFETAINAAAGTALIGDVIDTLHARELAQGHPLYFNAVIEEALASAGAATVDLKLVSDAQAAIATNGTATVHISTGPLAFDSPRLALGQTFSFALPFEGLVYERYLGVLVTTAVATTTAGKLTAFLSPSPLGRWRTYPEALS